MESRRRRLTAALAVALLSLSLLGSLALMSAAVQNSERFGAMYSTLLISNCLGLLTFVILIVINIREFLGQLRRREPGARLTLRMLLIFAALAITPVLVLYAFSLDFLRRGVDNWFDVRIDAALSDALELSRAALDLRMRDLLDDVQQIGGELASGAAPVTTLDLDALRNPESTIVSNTWAPEPAADLHLLRQEYAAEELLLTTREGRLLQSSSSFPDLVPHPPSEAVLLQLRQGRSYVGLDPINDKEIYIRVAVNVPDDSVTHGRRVLAALFPIASRLGDLAENVETAYAQYNELVYLREKLKLSFAMTLTLVLLFSVLTAAWAAFYSARRLVAPLRDLAAGTAAVAAGDYETKLPVSGTDEVGFLVSSFNDMTRRVAQARAEVEAQHDYVNTLLSQLSSGVIALDSQHVITTINDSAREILDLGEGRVLNTSIEQLPQQREHLRAFTDGLSQLIDIGDETWQQEIQIFTRSGRRALMVRGRSLSTDQETERGHVIIFDDITALIKGQRDAAWSEVARRLAHEIKNPLTPIQLSAERLRQKYLPRMTAGEAETLDRLTSTIVQQVDTMKSMVNTFSDYARPPKLTQDRVEVNELLRGVVDLFRSANPNIRFSAHFDATLPRFAADGNRLRQVFNNLIKNAVEATLGIDDPQVTVRTTNLVSNAANHVEIAISDNGPGIDTAMLANVFEPYTTNKSKGTGLGLAIVKKIVEEHGGDVTVKNKLDVVGACITVRLPLRDQENVSEQPVLERTAT